MKIEPKFYRANVGIKGKGATVICMTYYLDHSKQFVGVEYYQIGCSLDDHNMSIPRSRQATFQEALRVLHQSASTFKGPRAEESSHITEKLKEAYENNINIDFKAIE